MKKFVFLISMVILAGALGLGRDDTALRRELDILKPLVGKTGICDWKDPSGRQTLHLVCRYEHMHDGKILRFYQECRELNSQTDGYYYYDPDKKEIAFLQLTNNGNFAVGNVKAEGGKILEYGHVTFPNEKFAFRNTFELTANGELVDQFFLALRTENGGPGIPGSGPRNEQKTSHGHRRPAAGDGYGASFRSSRFPKTQRTLPRPEAAGDDAGNFPEG